MTRSMLYVLGAMLIASSTASASAQSSARFPEYRYITEGEEIYGAFDLGGFKELLRIDADLMLAEAELENTKERLEHLSEALRHYREVVEISNSSLTSLQDYTQTLFAKWEEENKKRHLAENKPNTLALVSWPIAVALAIVVAVETVVILGR